ncbi:E3 SUMO-protein ligase SIZ1 [Zea mays]|uniref:E3 SUMO-protein ligase SIZ1 n=1 Tax=Zea mays TaxID=4577 RepID=A0A3L6G2C7_MAIZE|nr:E3 SUMO-protein ligase SIZ1 [Zea mays]
MRSNELRLALQAGFDPARAKRRQKASAEKKATVAARDKQVWCILINDKVQFRMQWPQYAELQVNGIPVRVMTRPGSQLLGINGRDDGPLVTTCSREGINKISLSRVDARTFCFGVRIVRRTVPQVLFI